MLLKSNFNQNWYKILKYLLALSNVVDILFKVCSKITILFILILRTSF